MKGQLDGATRRPTLLILVGYNDRTNLLTIPARRALSPVYEAGTSPDSGSEVTDKTGDVFDFGVDQELNAGMPTGIHHFWTENSYRAIHGRERLVQRCHDPANG